LRFEFIGNIVATSAAQATAKRRLSFLTAADFVIIGVFCKSGNRGALERKPGRGLENKSSVSAGETMKTIHAHL
jgi:hypothetical protein